MKQQFKEKPKAAGAGAGMGGVSQKSKKPKSDLDFEGQEQAAMDILRKIERVVPTVCSCCGTRDCHVYPHIHPDKYNGGIGVCN